MYKIMSNQFDYSDNDYEDEGPLDSTILVEENVEWQVENNQEEAVNFPDSENTTINDINETYMTADGDNTTQYFSVLETSNETILNDISNVSLDNTKIVVDGNNFGSGHLEEDLDSNNLNAGHQVVLFKVDGSEAIYGIQIAQDEEGIFQKYQFKVRQNDEGNLIAEPDSLQILPLDGETDAVISNDTLPETESTFPDHESNVSEEPSGIFVKQELVGDHLISDIDEHDEQVEEYGEEHIDTKEGILELAPTVTQKQELFEPDTNSEGCTEDNSEHYFDHSTDDINENNISEEHYYEAQLSHSGQDDTDSETQGHYEQLFVKESHVIHEEGDQHDDMTEQVHIDVEPVYSTDSHDSHHSEMVPENLNENDSDNEDYEIVEGGVHVTGDTDEHSQDLEETNEFRKSISMSFQENILKQNPQPHKIVKHVIRKAKKFSNDIKNNSIYYLVKHPEKENVGEISNTVLRPNPRSILKCSMPVVDEKPEIDEEKYEKRFAKSKEAQQARLFHNFIAQTKIIHAPVRQERLPRKQKIKPMERTDEEIVVQEVVVSSNGFIETSEDGVVKDRTPLTPTDYIQLSDSDEDYDPKAKNKRKRKHKKRKSQVEITISDSDDNSSDNSIIEILASDDSVDEEEEPVASPKKRPRGRPPKNSVSVDVNSTTVSDKPGVEQPVVTHADNNVVKRPRGRPPKVPKSVDGLNKSFDENSKNDGRNFKKGDKTDEQAVTIKTDNKCSKCPKSFPSEGSLRTHMQYHNFKESNQNLGEGTSKDDLKPTIKSKSRLTTGTVENQKYKCVICDDNFKNNFLLTKHINSHKSNNSISCNICKKIFNTRVQLVTHKRSHVKEQMFKTTTSYKDSPKTRPKVLRKSPKKSDIKCDTCSRTFLSTFLLMAHMKSHKQFVCNSCKEIFLSKLMLDNHVRLNCVKTKSPARRVTFNVRKSYLNSPTGITKRVQTRHSEIPQVKNVAKPQISKSDTNNVVNNIKCDSCSMTFNTYTNLFKHKVIKHGLETPDKTIKNNPNKNSLHKPKGQHGGVLPTDNMKNSYIGLRNKLKY